MTKAEPYHSATVRVLTQLREAVNRVRERELAAILKRLPDLTSAQRRVVEDLSQSLMNEFMRKPSGRLRGAAANARDVNVVDAARYLFALDDGSVASAQHLQHGAKAVRHDCQRADTGRVQPGEPEPTVH